MNLLIVNGVTITDPTSYSVSIQDIVEAIRNGNGTLITDRKATKRKIEVSWLYLTNSQISTILTALNIFQFAVTYHDPETNGVQTRNFYVSDRKQGTFKIKDGVIVGWTGCSFSLIEI